MASSHDGKVSSHRAKDHGRPWGEGGVEQGCADRFVTEVAVEGVGALDPAHRMGDT